MLHSHKCGWEGRNHPPRERVMIVCQQHSFLLPSSTSMQDICSCNSRLVTTRHQNKVSVMMRIDSKQNTGRRSHVRSPEATTRNYKHAVSNTRLAVDSQNQVFLGDNCQSHAAKVSQNQLSIIPTLLPGPRAPSKTGESGQCSINSSCSVTTTKIAVTGTVWR